MMKKIPLKAIAGAVLAAAAFFAYGCSEKLELSWGEESPAEVRLRFSFGERESPLLTKSSLYEDTEKISDINIFIWRDGKCMHNDYVKMPSDGIKMTLVSGARYSFYAIANCGRRIVPQESGWESDERSMARLKATFPETDGAAAALPMAAVARDRMMRDGGQDVVLEMVRLVSRIVFEFRPDTALSGSGISITGVRLRDAAQCMTPFSDGSRAGEDEVADGDFSSETDLEAINGGGQMVFYAFENCWGDLLEGNTDQKRKVPDEIGEICGPTYIEVSCAFNGSGLLSGGITYRIYLGSDAVKNFDIVRNSSYRVQLMGSKDGLSEISWRIDKDLSYNDYLVDWEITRCAHEPDDLYAGEVFSAEITSADPSVISYVGDSLEDMAGCCTMRCIAGNTSGKPENDPIVFTPLKMDGGRLAFCGTCRDEVSGGELWLCDSEGRKISKVADGLNVATPELVFSSEERADMPAAEAGNPVATINGGIAGIRAYLCDREGRNLLAGDGKGFGFASDVFEFSVFDDSRNWADVKKAGGLSTYISQKYDQDADGLEGQPFCVVNLKMTNTGNDLKANADLWKMVDEKGCMNIGIADSRLPIIGTKSFDVSYIPFEAVFYDGAYGGREVRKKYGIRSLFFCTVKNPSRMSFNLRYLVAGKRHKSMKPLYDTEPPTGMSICYFDSPATMPMPQTLYMYLAEALVTSNSTGSFFSCEKTVADDGTIIIGFNRNLYDFRTAVMTADVQYKRSVYGYHEAIGSYNPDSYCFALEAMDIMIDLSSCTDGPLQYSFENATEDGGAEAGYVYSEDYKLRYIIGMTADEIPSGFQNRLYSGYPGVTPINMSKVMKQKRKITVSMEKQSSPYYSLKTDKAISNTYIKPSIVCRGFCRTHVNGQKKDPVDYTSEEIYAPSVTATYTSAGTKVNLSRTGINTLFQKIFDKTYNDSNKKYIKGTPWQHHAHPESLSMDLTFQKSGSTGSWFLYQFNPYDAVSLEYDNAGYSATYDSNPYTVSTSVDWKTTHGRFANSIVMIE